MTLQHPSLPEGDSSHDNSIGRMGAWTLGNLEQAFEQALDEAFRTCTSILDEIDPQPDCGDEGVPVGVAAVEVLAVASPAAIVPAGASRFRTCDGPVADGGCAP